MWLWENPLPKTARIWGHILSFPARWVMTWGWCRWHWVNHPWKVARSYRQTVSTQNSQCLPTAPAIHDWIIINPNEDHSLTRLDHVGLPLAVVQILSASWELLRQASSGNCAYHLYVDIKWYKACTSTHIQTHTHTLYILYIMCSYLDFVYLYVYIYIYT